MRNKNAKYVRTILSLICFHFYQLESNSIDEIEIRDEVLLIRMRLKAILVCACRFTKIQDLGITHSYLFRTHMYFVIVLVHIYIDPYTHVCPDSGVFAILDTNPVCKRPDILYDDLELFI